MSLVAAQQQSQQQQQQQPAEGEGPVFKAGASEVRLDVQVAKGKRIVADLTKEDFLVFDESTPQKLSYFGREAEPLTVVLLLDVSGSMKRFIQEMSGTALQSLKLLRKGDEVAVMAYARRAKLHFDFSSNFEEVAGRIRSAPDNPYTGSGTSTNEAVIDAAQLIAKRAPTGRRAIVLVTDNGGLNYQVPNEQVYQELYNANTVVNAIAVGKAEKPKPRAPNANPDFTPTDVFQLSETSGGEAIRAERADQTFPEMMERVRTRYALAYVAPEGVSKSFRRVRVDLTPEARKRLGGGVQVRVRKGYFVP
jgi:VWFA-related protein